MEEVYVVVYSYQYDSGETGEQVYVYDSFEKAKQTMKDIYVGVIPYYRERFGKGNYVEEKDEMWISLYKNGEYAYNHDNITIYQREVE